MGKKISIKIRNFQNDIENLWINIKYLIVIYSKHYRKPLFTSLCDI